ncbi:telomere length regulation protein TEL2 homolog isoform X2 [Arabidopsis lyrata subsp. lyrata]|uniref:telomere length regulation protein TEL2 homolog isoform X2 n=1 Tax=Arabidopsis lyrata subsp. lyrata TaxID=81972 RepID=UPI000A29C613|nr:telomere length regulation protein TEL2 homolog isoform X2 [Arabidopsis lyrata subsp. lyrata]|eukprot:XP_020880355.1 telomere length regulation protein TEL2 homolog isoform X2 [Arabidopsis lyrata subsp. lyrata]
MAEATEQERALENNLLNKVAEAISAISDARHVDQVISAIHSVAVLLFPVDPSLFSGSIGDKYRERVCSSVVPSADERNDWLETFYRGVAFPTFARVLLLDVASDWLSCFPISVQKHLYDKFFVDGSVIEVVQVLVPFLHHVGDGGVDPNSVQTNVERLLILCLLENAGVLKITKEIGDSYQGDNFKNGSLKPLLSRLSQILTSIPDKARLKAPPLLSSHLYFKNITNQLLHILDDRASSTEANSTVIVLSFVGEIFSRICRRGLSAHVRRLLNSKMGSTEMETFQLDPTSQIWSKSMEAVTDPYAVEKMAEQLLHQLYAEHASDVEAFWTIWSLFHRNVIHQASVRSIFVDKFLLWKVFPIRCLRWILQFSVLECPPVTITLAKGDVTQGLLETTQRLASVWSKREFLQSVPLEQQAYITAALGLCLENMSKEELDRTKDVMHSILQGVSCRLENPGDLVRKMASSIAFMFSKVIDPKNPLYLDDSFTGNAIDWEFGLQMAVGGVRSITNSMENEDGENKTSAALTEVNDSSRSNKEKNRKSKNISDFVLADPDEIVDLATLNCETESDKDDVDDTASVSSDNSSVTSLEPYDLMDDDKDLGKQFTHLVDVVGALRKSDDADGVEKAIYVAEKLVRASPDELTHIAGDLARTLVQVRCSDITIEGEEDSAEEKRQRALIALLVTRPFESLETLNNILYSPNVDVSQRIMILDVMSEAARELANSKTLKPKHEARGPLISNISDPQPWYLPSNASTPWKKVPETGSFHLNWANRFERELQSKPGQTKKGKSRRWSLKSADRDQNSTDWSQNKFPLYAAAFMLPAMKEFDKKRHGVDLLGRDFVVLGKLVHMLGVCIQCASMHPEASALAISLLDMLQRREVCNHPEAYVRRAVLFAASSVLVALHPSYIVSTLVEGNLDLSRALEWIRTWALQIADSDIDRDCYTMALSCLQLHAEMALQTSRALESTGGSSSSSTGRINISLPSGISKLTSIKLPSSNVHL